MISYQEDFNNLEDWGPQETNRQTERHSPRRDKTKGDEEIHAKRSGAIHAKHSGAAPLCAGPTRGLWRQKGRGKGGGGGRGGGQGLVTVLTRPSKYSLKMDLF